MATYLQLESCATNDDFQARCWWAARSCAEDIVNEAANTPNHAARVVWAGKVRLRQTNLNRETLAYHVLQNATIAAATGDAGANTSSDGDIKFQVASIIDSILLLIG